MSNGDLTNKELYEGVKFLVDSEKHDHVHLSQHKLFTLFSLAFQYLLYKSTKSPGAYIIRIEDSMLAEKLARKAKDSSSRKFLRTLLLPRKYKYQKSTFYLDFFHIGSWGLTAEIPKGKLKAALIIKNTSSRPMNEMDLVEDEEGNTVHNPLPPQYYLNSLKEAVPRTITIAFEEEFENSHDIIFPFIKKDETKTISGVTLSSELDWEKLDD
jgi:hypothetical protein